jgi:hypothetical protein
LGGEVSYVRYEVRPVIPKETDLVTAATAETQTIGSKVATVEPARYVKTALFPGQKDCILTDDINMISPS